MTEQLRRWNARRSRTTIQAFGTEATENEKLPQASYICDYLRHHATGLTAEQIFSYSTRGLQHGLSLLTLSIQQDAVASFPLRVRSAATDILFFLFSRRIGSGKSVLYQKSPRRFSPVC